MAAAPPLPKSKPVPPPPVRRPPQPEQAAVRPAPAAPAQAPPVETPVMAAGPAAPPPPSGAGGRAGTQASREAGSAEATAAGGLPGASADYLSLLQAWLARHKEYPRRSRMRRQEGTALLRFVMDRDGRVLDFSIQRSSGHPDLDHEVEQMIRRAQPLPPIPADLRQARLELVVPVQFVLR